jgi:hypothetical protein
VNKINVSPVCDNVNKEQQHSGRQKNAITVFFSWKFLYGNLQISFVWTIFKEESFRNNCEIYLPFIMLVLRRFIIVSLKFVCCFRVYKKTFCLSNLKKKKGNLFLFKSINEE